MHTFKTLAVLIATLASSTASTLDAQVVNDPRTRSWTRNYGNGRFGGDVDLRANVTRSI